MKNLLFSSLILFSACSTDQNNRQPEAMSGALTEPHQTEESIQLNGDEKWVVDEGILEAVVQMELDIEDYLLDEEADHLFLSSTLEQSLDQLISSCTMTGKSHDELHKWLIPLLDQVKMLSQAENQEEISQQIENIRRSLDTFYLFFQ